MSSAPPIQLPARISKYELLEFLGGGMSHVFRAKDTVLGRTVAIKILTPAGVADPDTKARFLHEARTASNISHENIMAVYDFGEEAGMPYMVMEFLRGRTLRAAIQVSRLPNLQGKLRVALQVAQALYHVHQNQIIHRDVKPENINLDDSGRAKLMDFGIAKSVDLSLTQPGYVLGTPYYMSPEQIMGKPVTPSVDIYAFGIMLYEMLLGTRPYGGDALETIFYKILHEPLDLSPLVAAGVPREVVAIVEHCSMKDAAARYADFSGVITDLENALGAQLTKKVTATPATPLPQGSPATKSRLPLILGAAIVVIVLAALGFYWISQSKFVPPKPPENKARQTVQKLPPERIESKGGAMHLVPGGAFLFGKEKKTAELPAFYMDETEVSNQYYASFCAENNYQLPKGFDAGHPTLPVVNVTIDDARAFARWAGKQLPNSLEWEKAARGKDGRTYPWGDEKDPSRANVADNPTLKQHGLQPVDSFSESVSPFNLLNMVGNVWEFIDEPWTPDADAIKAFAGLLSPPLTAADRWVTTRGGSYRLPLGPQMTWDVQPVPARYHNEVIGFRCVLGDVK